ncbi:hypothetical protein L3Y34_004558 [Caenorhabditis briggsae]|uniref:Uncharacterized protein n=1 Tax=Caenorhabditis briggsae TaxID=6238 RepID=A0AAE9D577_CAEBR|nr:hypothetical protein L3Y34_004558 [Caenorhabditis briggsae]
MANLLISWHPNLCSDCLNGQDHFLIYKKRTIDIPYTYLILRFIKLNWNKYIVKVDSTSQIQQLPFFIIY